MENLVPLNSIRPASVEDLDCVLAIEQICFPLPWTKKQFQEELEKTFSHFLVLSDDETDSKIFGYIVFWNVFEEIHILNITVDHEWRGLGFGKKLFRACLNQAIKNHAKKIFLEVRKSNQSAFEFYQSLGFFVDHIKPHFYENGEDAYFMTLFLDKKNNF